MKTEVQITAASKVKGAALIVGVYEGKTAKTVTWTAAGENAAAKLTNAAALIKAGDISTKPGKTTVLLQPAGLGVSRLVIVGLGKAGAMTQDDYVAAVKAAVKAAGTSEVILVAEDWTVTDRDEAWKALTAARTAFCTLAPIITLKTAHTEGAVLEKLVWLSDKKTKAVADALEAGRIEAENIHWARHLAELPPNICTPHYIAQTVKEITRKRGTGLSVKILERKAIEKAKMGGVLGVSKGSGVEPAFIEFSYNGAGKAAPVVLVGKGITFDAGGISLKPARGMDEMKFDMCGAAVMLAAVKAAAELKLPVNVTALVAACENMPSGTALKPSDVITMSDGKTVEILNTDAEGRLILADALVRAAAFKPAAVVDAATLTGHIIVALGSAHSGLFANDSRLAAELKAAGDTACDSVWRMPLRKDYTEALKSDVADMANIGAAAGPGASIAAAFLEAFAPKCPWAHLDVAGTANTHSGQKKATGRPLPLLLAWLRSRAAGEFKDAVPAEKAQKTSARKGRKAAK